MTKIVGIINLTDNSFAGDGIGNNASHALEKTRLLFSQGADIIDIGAQSTNYGARILSADEEWEILEPILKALKPTAYVHKISIDTFNVINAKKSIEYGIGYINDVKGGQNPEMLKLIAVHQNIKYICMFSLCIPADKSIRIKDFSEIKIWCEKIIPELLSHGIDKYQIILDPGISFVTNPELSLETVNRMHELKQYGLPLLAGHSRKSFFEKLTRLPPQERDIETLMLSLSLKRQGIDYIRVHNVDYHKRAFDMMEIVA